jgi:hypothetical protein
MFESEMEEARTSQAKIKDIDGEVMLEMVRFMYTGKVENIKDHAKDLLYAAEKYELKDLKKECLESLNLNLELDNVPQTLVLADRYNAKILINNCIGLLKM